jgi:hypothetical protein
MSRPTLSADCARCAALCCMALAFVRSDLFGIDKAAGEACANLDACGRCAIHGARAEQGFAGCVAYDCLGAGQRVTQDLFGGRSWLEEPALRAPMAQAFAVVYRAHGLLLLLREARRLPLSGAEGRRRARLEAALDAAGADPRRIAALEAATEGFLRTLRRHGIRRRRAMTETGRGGQATQTAPSAKPEPN